MKNRKWLSGGMGLGLVILCAVSLAAVAGKFSTVNATIGYDVTGVTPTSGYALCGDGTHFDQACAIPGAVTLFYQTIQEAGSGLTQQPILNFDGTVVASNGSGKTNVGLPNAGTAGTYAYPTSITFDAQGRETAVTAGSVTPRTCNSNGCYKIDSDGTIHEWGVSSTFTSSVNGTVSITFPVALTTTANFVMVASATTCNDTAGACGSGIHPYTCTPETTNTLSTSGVTMYYDGNGSTIQTGACQWEATGR